MIRQIPIRDIDDFPDHPFQVRDDSEMKMLTESIGRNGVMTPAIVRRREDGRYELISGHRRKTACIHLGIRNLPCTVLDLSEEEAAIRMAESNFQREHLLPSEKAFAYRMRMEAMKKQGQRSDLTSCPLGTKLSSETLSEEAGDSERQIYRYIRLTNLNPELLELVDEERIRLRPAVELSYLNPQEQEKLLDEIRKNQATPSYSQAVRLRKLSEAGALTEELLEEMMKEEKPNQKEKVILKAERIRKLIPKNIPIDKTEDYICLALDHYRKFLQRRRERMER